MSLNAFNLNDGFFGCQHRKHLASGMKLLGRGTTSAVYARDGDDYVIKITVDESWVDLMIANCHLTSALPQIHDVKEIGVVKVFGSYRKVFEVKMERLEKLKTGTDARKLAMRICRASQTMFNEVNAGGKLYKNRGLMSQLTSTVLYDLSLQEWIPESLREAFDIASDFCACLESGGLDVVLPNILYRAKTDEIVLADPISNWEVLGDVFHSRYGR